MGIEITEDVISQVYDMGDYFALQGHSQDLYEAKSVIVATGVKADMYAYKYFNGKSFKSAYLPVALEDISKTTIGQLFKDLDK